MISWISTRMPTQFNGERIVFLTNGAGLLDIHVQKKVDPYCMPSIKTQSRSKAGV